MGCRAENQSSHRRSFRVRNELPQWKNTDRPVIRSRSCKILAASSGQRGECEWPVTNQFEGTGDVLGLQLTRGIINTVLAVAKVAFEHEFPQQMKANAPLLVTFPSDPTFREPVSRDLAQRSHEGTLERAEQWAPRILCQSLQVLTDTLPSAEVICGLSKPDEMIRKVRFCYAQNSYSSGSLFAP